MSSRKRKKFFGDYVLVRRGDKVYIRRYPRDYNMWNKTRDPRYIHPNKLKTWVGLAKVAQKVRGKDYDTVMLTYISELRGRRYKPDKPPKIIPLKDFVGLKAQAVEKGLSEEIVDQLAVPAELIGIKETPEEKVKEFGKALIKIRQPLEPLSL